MEISSEDVGFFGFFGPDFFVDAFTWNSQIADMMPPG